MRESKAVAATVSRVDALEPHEVANIIPPMTPAEYDELRDSIAVKGQEEPIVIHEGKVLDGRHRLRVCLELGLKPRLKEWEPTNGLTPVEYVVIRNVHRRQLSASQKAAIAHDVLPHYRAAAKARQGQRTDLQGEHPALRCGKSGEAVELAASDFGTNKRYVRDFGTVAEADPGLAEQVRQGAETLPRAISEVKRRDRDVARREAADAGFAGSLPEAVQVIHADCREYLKTLPPDSVDLIFTDPPYTKESVPLYADLAEHAARILKPGASLLTYCGQNILWDVGDRMRPHLRPWWLFSLDHSGPSLRMRAQGVFNEWKPILWFVKGCRREHTYLSDKVVSGPPEKKHHNCQQHIAEAAYCIRHLTTEGELVVDPFCGSGTTLVAALRLGRRAIGVDIDEQAVGVARRRVLEVADAA